MRALIGKWSTLGRKRDVFTLVELLIVVAIIAMLAGLLLPALAKAKDTALRISCAAKLKQVYLAAAGYAEDNNQFTPCESYYLHVTPLPIVYSSAGEALDYYYWYTALWDYAYPGKKWPARSGPAPYTGLFAHYLAPDNTIFEHPQKNAVKWAGFGTAAASYDFFPKFGMNAMRRYDVYANPGATFCPKSNRLVQTPSEGCFIMDSTAYYAYVTGAHAYYNFFAHVGGNNVLYLDGHAVSVDPRAIPRSYGEGGGAARHYVPFWTGVNFHY